MKASIVAVACVVTATGGSVLGQPQGLSGTWELDLPRSQISPPLLHGGGDDGPAHTLYVTQAANGTLTLGTNAHSGNAWAYTPGGESSIPLGETDRMPVTARWDGDHLISEGHRDAAGSDVVIGVKEVHSLSDDGQTLTITQTTTKPNGETTNTLVYRKLP